MAHQVELTPEDATNRVDLGKYVPLAGIFAIVGLVATGLMFAGNAQVMAGSYLYGLVFWLSITLGMFGLSILHHTVRGSWSVSIIRLLEAGGGATALATMFALFIPVIAFMPNLYEWMSPEAANDHLLKGKLVVLNQPVFIGYTAFCFVLWIWFAAKMRASTRKQEETGDFQLEVVRTSWGAAGMLGYFLTVSFAIFLWLMSMNPHWYSTMYGVWMIVMSAGGALALCNVIVCSNAQKSPYNTIIHPNLLKDLGNMQFVTVMLWGYTSISQFLIIWNGNIPETTSYFKDRSSAMHPPGMESNHWGWVGLILILGRFFIPFFALIAPRTKKKPHLLRRVCAFILIVHVIDIYLLVQPSIPGRAVQGPLAGHLINDLVAFITVGAIWFAVFASQLKKSPLLPKYDHRLQEALQHAH